MKPHYMLSGTLRAVGLGIPELVGLPIAALMDCTGSLITRGNPIDPKVSELIHQTTKHLKVRPRRRYFCFAYTRNDSEMHNARLVQEIDNKALSRWQRS